MNARTGAAGVLLAALLFVTRDASADEDNGPGLALLAGGGLVFASATAGFTIEASTPHRDGKNAAIVCAQTGMTLAPIVAHGIVGESTRGLWFALPLVASEITTMALMSAYPDFVKRAPPGIQYGLAVTLTLSIFGGTLGVVDALFAPDRRKPKPASSSLSFAPLFGGGTAGAMLIGSL